MFHGIQSAELAEDERAMLAVGEELTRPARAEEILVVHRDFVSRPGVRAA